MRTKIHSDQQVYTGKGSSGKELKSTVLRRIEMFLEHGDLMKEIPKDEIELEEEFGSNDEESFFKITIYRISKN